MRLYSSVGYQLLPGSAARVQIQISSAFTVLPMQTACIDIIFFSSLWTSGCPRKGLFSIVWSAVLNYIYPGYCLTSDVPCDSFNLFMCYQWVNAEAMNGYSGGPKFTGLVPVNFEIALIVSMHINFCIIIRRQSTFRNHCCSRRNFQHSISRSSQSK